MRLRGGEDPGEVASGRATCTCARRDVPARSRRPRARRRELRDRTPTRTSEPSIAPIQSVSRSRCSRRYRPGSRLGLVEHASCIGSHRTKNATTLGPSARSSPRLRDRGGATSRRPGRRKRPYTTGPAPLTSARNAPRSRSLAASGERARSLGGSARQIGGAARARDPSTSARARGEPVLAVEARVDLGRSNASLSPCGSRSRTRVVLRQVDAARASSRRRCRAAARFRGRTGRRRRGRGRAPGAGRAAAGAARRSFASRSAVAASELPPPRPAATGIRFSIRARQRGSTRRGGDRFERPPDERVVREAVDRELGGRLERDRVAELDPLEDRRDLVQAVVPRRPDDEREVDLRRGRRADHASAAARATNSGGSSSSARTPGPRPIAVERGCGRRGDASPRARASSRASCGGARTRPRRVASPPGRCPGAMRRNATSAESTFGRGRKTSRETGWKPVRSVASCTSTETAP